MQDSELPARACCEALDNSGNPSATPQCRAIALPQAPPRVTHIAARCTDAGNALEISITTSRPALIAYAALAATDNSTSTAAATVLPAHLLAGTVGAASARVAAGQAYSHIMSAGGGAAHAVFTTCPFPQQPPPQAAVIHAVARGPAGDTGGVFSTDVNVTAVCSDAARAAAQAEQCAARDFLRHLRPLLTPQRDALAFPAGRPIISIPSQAAADSAAASGGAHESAMQMLQDVFVIDPAAAAGAAAAVTITASVAAAAPPIPASVTGPTAAAIHLTAAPLLPVHISAALLTPAVYLQPHLSATSGVPPANASAPHTPLMRPAVPYLEFVYSLRDAHGDQIGGGTVGGVELQASMERVRVVAALLDGNGVLARLGGCSVSGEAFAGGWGRCRAEVPDARFPAAGGRPAWVYAVLELQVRMALACQASVQLWHLLAPSRTRLCRRCCVARTVCWNV